MFQTHHDPALVSLAVLVSIFASFTALSLASHARASGGTAQRVWLGAAAVATGGGIWSMHFVAMLAFSIVSVTITYEPLMTIGSLLIAILFSGLGLFIALRFRWTLGALATGGVFMGLGVASMHYMGMAAMTMAATISYDPLLFGASILIAIVASKVALWLCFNLKHIRWRIASAFVMAAAVTGMHYTGMAAASYAPIAAISLGADPQIPAVYLGVAIGVATMLTLALGLATAVVDQRLAERANEEAERLRKSEERFRLLVNSVKDYAIFMLDPEGRVASWNDGAEAIEGYTADEAIGQPISIFLTAGGDPDSARDMLSNAEKFGRYEVETRRRRKNGEEFWANIVIHPIRDGSGNVTGFVKVTRDISERKAAEKVLHESKEDLEIKVAERTRELNEAKIAAETSNLAKSKFLANISHELRTPLNAIIGYTEMLMEEMADAGRDENHDDLAKIEKAGRHLLGLINEVLDLAKIEAGKMELNVDAVDGRELIDQVVATIEPLVLKGRNRFEVVVAETLGDLRIDAQKVRQCLFNLLSNAAKFTSDGTVSLTAVRAPRDGVDSVVVTVTDTGIGMNAEQQDKIFSAFYQVDDEATRSYEGSGLGLTITRHLCRMMGGDITVASESGAGSTFTMWFDADRAGGVSETASAPVERQRTPETVREQVRQKLVFMVEDDADAVELMTRTLVRAGYKTASADNGNDALRMIGQLLPDAVLLDIKLPGLDGREVLAALKANAATAHIPVIIVSMTDNSAEALALGAAEFLTKPVSGDRLEGILRARCGGGRKVA